MHSFHSVVSYRSSHQSNKAKMRFLSVNLTIGLRVQRYNFFFNEKKILQHNHNAVKLKTGKHTSIRGYRFCWVGDALPQNPYLLKVFKKSVREQHGCGHQKEDRQAVFFCTQNLILRCYLPSSMGACGFGEKLVVSIFRTVALQQCSAQEAELHRPCKEKPLLQHFTI